MPREVDEHLRPHHLRKLLLAARQDVLGLQLPRFEALLQDQRCADALPECLVGCGEAHRQLDAWHLRQRGFHLVRVDGLTSAIDHLLAAAGQVQPAILVHVPQIARPQVAGALAAAGPSIAVGILVVGAAVLVAFHDQVPSNADLSLYELDLCTDGWPHRAGPIELVLCRGAGDFQGLRHAIGGCHCAVEQLHELLAALLGDGRPSAADHLHAVLQGPA
mmetsp:Transcript_94366/g.224769  ORF Transcript_94366/g.224769 Transcript_94366/m.224769 type:complete len:219 (+) Transcript_94366:1455-2111(+)